MSTLSKARVNVAYEGIMSFEDLNSEITDYRNDIEQWFNSLPKPVPHEISLLHEPIPEYNSTLYYFSVSLPADIRPRFEVYFC